MQQTIGARSDLPRMAYTVKEACSLLTISRTTLYRHINDGLIEAVRLGGRTIIPAANLQRLMQGKGGK